MSRTMQKLELDIPDKPSDARADSCGCGTGLKEITASDSCCNPSGKTPHWVIGSAVTPTGPVPRVSTRLEFQDRLGAFRSRTSAYRMSFKVPPGLYAVGEPDADSTVLVTANYKLSFDHLRRSLTGRSLWILVLETHGINVWCAAGKGTFGTDELVNRIQSVRLDRIVSHRRVVVPQLGAPGVSAPLVRKRSGFRVSFGPVRSSDLPAFLDGGLRADESMRRIRFSMLDRLVLTPMEIRPALKYFPAFALMVLVLFGLEPGGVMFGEAWAGGYPFLLLGLGAVFSGAFFTPLFLPYIPFRSFAVKGWLTGVVFTLILLTLLVKGGSMSPLLIVAAGLLFPSVSSYIALQFTGSATFTGMSGVRRELRFGLPFYVLTVGAGVLSVLVYKFAQWGWV